MRFKWGYLSGWWADTGFFLGMILFGDFDMSDLWNIEITSLGARKYLIQVKFSGQSIM